MADIDIVFGTNAGTVAPQVDRVAASTEHAAAATHQHAKAVTAQASALAMSTREAKLRGTASKEEIVQLRLAEIELRKKARALHEVEAANKVGLGGARGQIFLAKQVGLGHGAHFAHALGLGHGGGLAGMALGVGAGAGIGLALELATETAAHYWNKSAEEAKKNAEKTHELNQSLEEALKSRANSGMGASKFGNVLTGAIGSGGNIADLKKLGDKYGLEESAKAYMSAKRIFPGEDPKRILEAAGKATSTMGNGSLSEMVEGGIGLRGSMSTQDLTLAMANISSHGNMTQADFGARSARVSASPELGMIGEILSNKNKLEMSGLEPNSLNAGVAESAKQVKDAFEGLVEAAKAVTAQFNEEQKKIADKKAADEAFRTNLGNTYMHGGGGF